MIAAGRAAPMTATPSYGQFAIRRRRVSDQVDVLGFHVHGLRGQLGDAQPYGFASGFGTAGDTQLGEDRSQVGFHRALAEHELFGDAGVVQPLRQQPEDLQLALAEAAA